MKHRRNRTAMMGEPEQNLLKFAHVSAFSGHREAYQNLQRMGDTTPLADMSEEHLVESSGTGKQQRQKPTHFLSIPLVTEAVKERFDIFRDTLLEKYADSLRAAGVDEAMLVERETLHITVGSLYLYTEAQVAAAKQILGSLPQLVAPLRSPDLLQVEIKGLHHVFDDRRSQASKDSKSEARDDTKANYLCARTELDVDSRKDSDEELPSTLDALVATIAQPFLEAGLMKTCSRGSSMTLVKSKHLRNDVKRDPFQAGELLSKPDLQAFSFGSAPVTAINLTKMKRAPDGLHFEVEDALSLLEPSTS